MKFKNLRNRLRQRRLQIHRDLPIEDTGLVIRICKNPTKLGKRYIAKMYKDGKLVASYPANDITDIDLKYFNP